MSDRTSESPGGPAPPRRKRDITGNRVDRDPAGENEADRSDRGAVPPQPGPPAPVWSESDDTEDENWVETPTGAPDDGAVLDEIAHIQGELTAHPAGRDPRASHPEKQRSKRGGEDGAPTTDREMWGAPSPYLEERLTVARSAAERLASEAEWVERSVSSLKGDLETIHRELGRATDELGFLRSEEASENGTSDSGLPASHGSGDGTYGGVVAMSVAAASPVLLPSAPTTAYASFTVARYNDTVLALHARRRSLAWETVVLAAGISALLFALTLRAHEPLPVIWLAVLPLIWMIPVPFFLAAFLGTQRVLKKNRLELRGAT